MHIETQNQCTVNDRVRGIFRKILMEEIDYYNTFIKYGKAKGWLNPVPNYVNE